MNLAYVGLIPTTSPIFGEVVKPTDAAVAMNCIEVKLIAIVVKMNPLAEKPGLFSKLCESGKLPATRPKGTPAYFDVGHRCGLV
jgi:hypothetical protein